MNRIYRLVFNRQLGVMQVASELASSASSACSSASVAVPSRSSRLRPLALCVLQALLLGAAGSAFAADVVIFNGNDRINDEIEFKDGFIVGSDQAGALKIVNGGHVTTDRSIVGDQEGSKGTLIVDGPDAWLKFHNSKAQFVSGALIIGNEGSGTLQILNGGRAEPSGSGDPVYFAVGATSDASVLVDGQGSLLQASYFRMGGAGSGTATVSNGGKIVSTSSISTGIDLAYSAGSNFTLDVLGKGSEVSTGNAFYVGKNGSAALNIRDGGAVRSAGWIYAGDEPGSSGDILVDGAGSLLSGGRGLTLSLEGDASLRVTNGGTVTLNDNLWTSYDSGSTSSLLVDGAGSTLSTGDGSLLVGRTGSSEMIVSHGGQVHVGDALVGTSGGSNGSILVDGEGSQLIATGEFLVGDIGKGELTIRNGGQVSASSMLLSDAVISASDKTTGKVTVDGAGSALTITGTGLLTVGGTGNGTLDVTNGGRVSAGNVTIGQTGSGYQPTNVLTVNGAGSSLEVADVLRVGDGANGSLIVGNGAHVSAGRLIQGSSDISDDDLTGGRVEITGEGTQLTADDLVTNSQFILSGGAVVSTGTASFANASNDTTAMVTGAGTSLTVSDALTLEGNLDVTDGAIVNVGSVLADYNFFVSKGVQLHVSGAGSSFKSAGDVTLTSILSQGSGTILLSDDGYFSAGENTILAGTGAQVAFGANQLSDEAQASGELDAKTNIQLDGEGVLVFNHTENNLELANTISSFGYDSSAGFRGSLLSKAGTTRLTGDLHAFNGDINVEGGKLVLAGDVNTLPPDYNIDEDIGKDYQEVNVVGDGTLVVDGDLGYAWQFNAGNSIETRGSTVLQVYGREAGEAPVLAGSGSVTGTVYVGDGGIISPGDGSAATFTINGDLYFTGNTVERGGVFAVDVKGDGTSDKLMVTGVADLRENDSDGANPSEVRVSAIDAATSYQDGQTYTILHADGGVLDTFSSVTSQSAFLTPTLTYTANDVMLTIALDTSNLPMTVSDGQTLSGNGSYGNVQVLSGGRLSPGTADSRIGALAFNGDLSFAAGAFYDVDLKGTTSTTAAAAVKGAVTSTVNDLVNVTGKATLSGGTVQVTALDPQTSYQDGHSYTILHADGGVAGSFDEVTSKSAFLIPTLSYSANDVAVAIKLTTAGGEPGEGGGDDDGGNGTSPPPPIFETVADSRNQYNIARALDTLPQQGEGLALYNRLLMLDADSARAAFGSLSGEIHTAVRAGLLEDRFVREGVSQRLAGQVAASGKDGITGWVASSGASGRIDGDGNGARMQGRREGVLAGVDFALGQDSLIGVAGGHEDLTRQVKQWQSEADIDANEIGLYAATRFGALQLSGGVDYADYDVRSRRQAVVGTTADTLHGDYDASATTVYAEAGWTFGDEALSVTPYLNLAHTRLETDGVTETGGSSALAVADSKDELLTSTLGARLAWDISGGLGDGAVLTAGLAWQNASGELKADNRARFVVGSDEFRSYGTPLARNVGIAEIGVGVDTNENSRVSLAAQGRAGDGQREFGAQLNWQWRF